MPAHPFGASPDTFEAAAGAGSGAFDAERARALTRSARPLDVLVADDDEDTLRIVVLAIRSLGHHVRAAGDGNAAWRLLEEHTPDVVVSDWEMPGMSGAELCRRTRESGAEGRYTYFILLTAHADREHLLEGMAAGADDFQRKPVDLDELEARLVSAARVVDLHHRLAEKTRALRRDSDTYFAASRTDELTGLGNRLRMREELQAAMARASRYGERYSLAICDLDGFKLLNDTLGHLAGDEALVRVATVLRAELRSSDGLFRYGGDEFVILLTGQTPDEASIAVERVRAAVDRLHIPVGNLTLSLSAGIADLDPSDRDAEAWVARADAALYAAKAGGRNRLVIATRSKRSPGVGDA